MKKTLSISIAGTLFWIEEDAYQTLDVYLSGIKKHFAGAAEKAEIVADIESRIAEQFIESGKKIITAVEVEGVVASMGSVKDFGGSNDGTESTDRTTDGPKDDDRPQKRLYRNPDDKVVAGVASGIAAYLGVDVVWVRIIFGLLVIANGFGILLYIVLWLSMPEAKTGSQRLQMEGAPINIETISERVKERVDEISKDEDGTLRKIVRLPFEFLRGVFRFLGTRLLPLLGKIVGGIVSFGTGLAIIGASVVAGIILTHLGGDYVDFPLREVVSAATIIIATIVGYFAIVIPLLFIQFFGTTLIIRRFPVSAGAVAALLGAWFIAIVIAVVMGLSIGSRVAEFVSTDPMYQETEKVVAIAPFSVIDARNGVNVSYVQGATTTVTLSGRMKDIDRMVVEVKDGILRLEPKHTNGKFCIFCDHGLPKVIVTAPAVTHFMGENGVNIGSDKFTSTSTVSVSIQNGSRGVFSIHAPEVALEAKNAASLSVSGSTTLLHISGENGVHINAESFSADKAEVSMQNGSRLEIGKTNILNASARNGAAIEYTGTTTLSKDIKNGSHIKSTDEEDEEEY